MIIHEERADGVRSSRCSPMEATQPALLVTTTRSSAPPVTAQSSSSSLCEQLQAVGCDNDPLLVQGRIVSRQHLPCSGSMPDARSFRPNQCRVPAAQGARPRKQSRVQYLPPLLQRGAWCPQVGLASGAVGALPSAASACVG
jgi:hypothetical protein